ncbi:MAG: hypothetical protein Tsb0034_11290 [Ekhidna sp.]
MNLFRGLSGKFLIPYALTLVFGIWTYFTITNIRQLQRVKDSLMIINSKLLELRKHEKDFLAREYKSEGFLTSEQSKYIDAFQKEVSKLDSMVLSLVSLDFLPTDKADTIDVLLKKYSDTFMRLTHLIHIKGFKDWGMEGELRATIHAIEKDDADYDRYYMLMLRRHEKDFFLRSDLKYLEKFHSGVDNFEAHLNRSISNTQKRESILTRLGKYEATFERIVDISERIGLNEEEGLHGELRDAIHELTPFVNGLVINMSDKVDARVRRNLIMLIVLFVLIIGVGVVILTWHIKKITRNINVIKANTRLLAEGKFPKLRKVNSRDELGQAHQSINILIEGLKAKSNFAEKIGKGKLDTSLEALSEHDVLAHSLLEMRDNLKNAISATNQVVKRAGEEGYLEARMDVSKRRGAWKDLANSINVLLFTISTPLITLNRIFNEMAKGNLSLRYKSEAKGDIAVLTSNLNKGLDNLQQLISKLELTANEVGASSQEMYNATHDMRISTSEIASAIAQISSGAQTQVVRVDETSSLAERLLKSAEQMGERSSLINAAAKKGVEVSENGSEMVGNMTEAMQSIKEFSSKTNASIKLLNNRSNQIGNVLRVINEISSQTNLLALNAAIEAAQAGEAGRGFAVVAEEIRKLAEETKHSAHEIENLVEGVNSEIVMAVKNMEAMSTLVESGAKITDETSDAFKEIAVTTRQNLGLSEEILATSSGQREDIKEIVKKTESIVVIAEETAAGTEESAASSSQLSAGMDTYSKKAERLSEIAQELKDDLEIFKLHEKKDELPV